MGQACGPDGRARRDGQGRFAQGRSGNPKGRPSIPTEVRQAARLHMTGAIAVLVEVLNSPSATLPMRSMAARAILRAAGGLGTVLAPEPPLQVPARCSAASSALEAYVLAVKVLRDIADDGRAPVSARAKAAVKLRNIELKQ